MIAPSALFVDPLGPYPSLGIDWWDEKRDALLFKGRNPVILHPPCGRWCAMARLNERRWGAKVGDDGGLFKWALTLLRRNGGVLEHPARSIAWDTFALPKPTKSEWEEVAPWTWVCEVWQSAYGHAAHKRTWLMYQGIHRPFPLNWTRDRSLATAQIGGGIHTGNRQRPRLNQKLAHLTPLSFAQDLIRLTENARRPAVVNAASTALACNPGPNVAEN